MLLDTWSPDGEMLGKIRGCFVGENVSLLKLQSPHLFYSLTLPASVWVRI